MRFILTGVSETTSAEKSPLYILGKDCNGSHYPPHSPSWRAPAEMTAIPEHRISTCSRSSSTSTDSRANFGPVQPPSVFHYPQRQSSTSHSLSESAPSSFRQSLHSTSSAGSLDGGADDSATGSCVNVAELVRQGMSPADIIYTWLNHMRYEAYLPNFIHAGYDIATISRMTPEDLTAIGITKPSNRKRLTLEIAKLNIPDGIPDFLPVSVCDWLTLLQLDEYQDTLERQYPAMDDVQQITWEDLQDMGIHKLGHQKKIMLAVDRLKKITKRQSQGSTPVTGSAPYWSADMSSCFSYSTSLCSGSASDHDLRASAEGLSVSAPSSRSLVDAHYRPSSIVPIQIRTNLSRSSSGNSINSNGEFAVPRCSSLTRQPDREPTPPSSEDSNSSCNSSMNRSALKRGPMRGIHGLPMSKHGSQDSVEQHRHSMDATQYATLRRSGSRKQSSQSLDFHTVPQSPEVKNGVASPGPGSIPSPFSEFKSPYAQIQSGQVKNQLGKDKKCSSVPSSPVTKSGDSSLPLSRSAKKAPAPPKRTMSMKQQPASCDPDDPQQEFPPPLAPVSFNLEAMKGFSIKSNRQDYTSLELPLRDSLKLQNVNDSLLAARRRAGSTEKEQNINNNNNSDRADAVVPQAAALHQSASTSSTSSSSSEKTASAFRNSTESIPFANDNVGTMRQRSAHPVPDTEDILEDNMEKALEPEESDIGEIDFNTVRRMPKPVPAKHSQTAEKMNEDPIKPMEQPNVLTDINMMFDSLSCELDDALLDK